MIIDFAGAVIVSAKHFLIRLFYGFKILMQ